ncbi:MAG: hypothetical protein ABJH05_10625 [Fulvivirga sp.]
MVYFKEEQRFNQWWMWAIIIPVVTGVALLCIHKLNEWLTVEDRIPDGMAVEWRILIIIFALILTLAIAFGIFKAKLETQIKDNAIKYRFRPFIFKWRKIKPEDIKDWQVRTYSPIAEYGGWGVRFTFGNSRAVNVKGNKGLQLHLISGKKLLIGTQKPKEIELVMEKMMTVKKESYG